MLISCEEQGHFPFVSKNELMYSRYSYRVPYFAERFANPQRYRRHAFQHTRESCKVCQCVAIADSWWRLAGSNCGSQCRFPSSPQTTYEAKVTVPKWSTCLMSALETEPAVAAADGSDKHTFSWKQSVPIPSYLIALAVGDLDSRGISDRCWFK